MIRGSGQSEQESPLIDPGVAFFADSVPTAGHRHSTLRCSLSGDGRKVKGHSGLALCELTDHTRAMWETMTQNRQISAAVEY